MRGRLVHRAQTLDIQDSVTGACEVRNDDWAATVRVRIRSVHDLPAADAIYHHKCSTNFRTNMQMPKYAIAEQPDSKKRKLGRPANKEASDAFMKVVRYLEENDDELITISTLVSKIQETLTLVSDAS